MPSINIKPVSQKSTLPEVSDEVIIDICASYIVAVLNQSK